MRPSSVSTAAPAVEALLGRGTGTTPVFNMLSAAERHERFQRLRENSVVKPRGGPREQSLPARLGPGGRSGGVVDAGEKSPHREVRRVSLAQSLAGGSPLRCYQTRVVVPDTSFGLPTTTGGGGFGLPTTTGGGGFSPLLSPYVSRSPFKVIPAPVAPSASLGTPTSPGMEQRGRPPPTSPTSVSPTRTDRLAENKILPAKDSPPEQQQPLMSRSSPFAVVPVAPPVRMPFLGSTPTSPAHDLREELLREDHRAHMVIRSSRSSFSAP